MNFKLLFPAFLILTFSPAFGALSDATGLVNRFDVETGGHLFEITTTSNFDVQKLDFDKEQKRLTFHIVSSIDNNLGEIIIPKNLLSGNFTFHLNDQEYNPKVRGNDKITFVTLNFTGLGDSKLDVYATKYLEGIIEEDSVDSEIDTVEEENSQKGGGCLIATATYGSELAPQVQKLRELRDDKILQTKTGSVFIQNFNSFYYSFSPAIADYERQNPIFKEFVKFSITPLISSLSILNSLNLDSEAQVIGFGVSLIALNIGMYFAFPVLLYRRLKQ